jgi:hypothetical protein
MLRISLFIPQSFMSFLLIKIYLTVFKMRFLTSILLLAPLFGMVAAPGHKVKMNADGEREAIGGGARVSKPKSLRGRPRAGASGMGKVKVKAGAQGVGGVKASGKTGLKKRGGAKKKTKRILNLDPVDKPRILADLEQYEPPLKAAVDLLDHRTNKVSMSSVRLLPYRAFLLAGYASTLLFLAVVVLPLYIDTNHNDVGGDAHFM